NLGNDTILCPGDIYTLDASIPGAATYRWGDGSTDPQKIITSPGTYYVEVDIGCSLLQDWITIDYYTVPDLPLPNDTSICSGSQITLNGGDGYVEYLWQDGSQNQTYTTDLAGEYWVQVENDNGCYFSDSVEIGIITKPEFSLGQDTSLCFGEQMILDPGINSLYMEYLWSENSTDSTVSVADSGNYWLIASNPCGTHYDTIYIDFVNCNPGLFFPNAFSPNGDGKNEIFRPKGVNISSYRMLIYDRWGSLMFESRSMDIGWDGCISGQHCPAGVYVWIVIYESLSRSEQHISETLKGTLLLLN
ncbi:MAG: gliding motility-associated C-terminal domain-containing protein, partial [Bacteroidota bacterium]|nr:gliding motility-associated C-terminal domain-containing protein [Bacteroidota bacterium]